MGGVGRSAVVVVGKVNRCERGVTVTIMTSKSKRRVPSPVWSNACSSSSSSTSSGATGVGTGEVRAEQSRAGLGAGAAGGPKERKVPSWEVVLGQTGRLGNYMAGTLPGSLGSRPWVRQAGRPAGT